VLAGLRQRTRVHRLVAWAWLAVCLGTLGPSVLYVRERVLQALHPWSGPAASFTPALGVATMATSDEAALEAGAVSPAPQGKMDRRSGVAQQRYALSKSADAEVEDTAAEQALQARQASLEPTQVREKTVRPVAFEASNLPGVHFSYGFGSLPPGQAASAKVWLVGPWLRGLWLVGECAALAAVLALLLRRSRRLWWDEEVAS
jgi:hypothetical protein